MPHYPDVHSEKRSNLESVKSRLPKSVKNLVFASQVCIKNVEYGRYLYSPNDYSGFQFGDNRRYVLTWKAEERATGGEWKVELKDDNVYLKNVRYGRYLYSPNDYSSFQFGDNRRYVLTWKAEERATGGEWKVELKDDNVYLKNVRYGRYLYSPNDYSSFQFGDNRRYVLTWKAEERVTGCEWKIEDCSNGRRRRDVMDNTTAYEKGDMEENAQPSSHISDIVLEKVKTTDKNISFIGR
ncbi:MULTISPECIES: RICIN domain-containing protein [unclassified Wolbachia]|uniref:RICIN domain-containing protein n=1 Tax=unclassified Wolbachia TaxID=2640676 RepID=UPI00222FDB2F|nr:hypothetical protein [Wolbachia endosymbiont (group A) of Apoderus coryli]